MHFPKLPVLKELRREVGSVPQLQDTVLVALQHVLETTGSMFDTLFRMGLKPENVFLTGKIYSEHRETACAMQRELGINYQKPEPPRLPGFYDQRLYRDAKKIWQKVCLNSTERVVVLDDGGHLLRSVPPSLLDRRTVVGIEQTTYGTPRQTLFGHFPVIQAATSAAKSYLEPPLITEAILKKVRDQMQSMPDGPVGVVGLGRIGKAVVRGVLENRETVFTFDKDKDLSLGLQGAKRCNSLTRLVDGSRTIFGCTGQDISEADWVSEVRGRKVLVSCSSSDVEFRELLRTTGARRSFDTEDPLAPLELEVPSSDLKLTVLRGGFPINFDRTKESVPAQDIQLTRGLLAGGVLQAVQSRPSGEGWPNRVKLSPRLQRLVVRSWFEDRPDRRTTYQNHLLKKFGRLRWIREHSAGSLPHSLEKWP